MAKINKFIHQLKLVYVFVLTNYYYPRWRFSTLLTLPIAIVFFIFIRQFVHPNLQNTGIILLVGALISGIILQVLQEYWRKKLFVKFKNELNIKQQWLEKIHVFYVLSYFLVTSFVGYLLVLIIKYVFQCNR